MSIKSILQALAKAGGPLSTVGTPLCHEGGQGDMTQLGLLTKRGLIKRSGTRGSYRYRLAPKGRTYMRRKGWE